VAQPKAHIADESIRVITPEVEPGHATAGLGVLWSHRSLLWDFVQFDLKQRYTGGSLGFFWTVVTPLLELVTYTFVFHGLLGIRFEEQSGWTHYALYLFCGMVTWLSFSDGLSQAGISLTNNGHLIKKIHFPTLLLPTHVVLSAAINQVIRTIILILAILLFTQEMALTVMLVPLVMVFQLVLTLGVGLLLSVGTVYFRDMNHWVNASLLLLMFLTPVVYPAAVYPRQYSLLLQLNPLAHLVGLYRELLLNGALPHPHSIIIVMVTSCISLLIGYSVFHHHQRRLADVV
jgi:lipopolysaccharide transport system permease protein